MNGFFRRLPLPVKLTLIGLVPFLFLILLSLNIYKERSANVDMLYKYIKRVNEASRISQLIEELQKERRNSFIYSMSGKFFPEFYLQRKRTDSILQSVRELNAEELKDFQRYTFLNDLEKTRRMVDSLPEMGGEIAMSFYTNTIFRLNSLNVYPSESNTHLKLVNRYIDGQKILSQMITYLGILRANIYNVLYTQRSGVNTLYGLRGVNEIYKSYETEFLVKAPQATIDNYQQRLHEPELRQAVDYMDRLFINYAFDSTFTAEQWWEASGQWINQLYGLQQELIDKVNQTLSAAYKKEKKRRDQTMIFLVISLVAISSIVMYTIHSISQILNELKTAAKSIARGAEVTTPSIISNDVIGDLALSISEINKNNRQLARSAEAIGHGDFSVAIRARSEEDVLGHSVVRMKQNLQQFTSAIEESREKFQQLAEKYRTIFYKGPLPKLIYDEKTLRILEVNEAAITHYGYTEQEFLKLTLADLLDKNEGTFYFVEPDNNSNGHEELFHVKKNGERIIVELTSLPIEYNDRKTRLAVVNDITERRRTEQAIRISEQTRSLIINAALDAIVCMDIKGDIIVWNPQAEKIFGWSESEAIGLKLSDTIIPMQYRQRHNEGMRRYLETGEGPVLNKLIEITALNRDGIEFPVELSILPIKQGGFEFFCAFLRDITLRKKAEEDIKSLAFRNQQILLTMQDGFVLTDTKRKIVDVNPAYCAMVGFTKEELLTMKIDQLEGLTPMYELEERLNEVRKTGSIKFEGQNRTKDGRMIDVEVSTSIMEMDGKVMVAGFVRNITERKKAEEQLSGERNLLRSLIDNLPDYIYVKDIDSRYIINNKAFVKLVGAGAEEHTIGKKVTEFFNKEIWEINEQEDKRVIERGEEIIDRDEPIITKDGEQLWLLTTKIPLKDKEGKVIGILGISKDITERKRAEAALKQSYDDIRELASHLENIREEERIHIAREIHDELGQQLTVLKMDVSWLNKKLVDSDDITRNKLAGLLQLLETTVKTVRKISSELRPSMLDDLGLVAALEWQSLEFERRTGIKSSFLAIMPDLEIDKKVSTALFRIYQESLTNVARHSQATEVIATLKFEKSELVLTIIDNGKGFNTTGIENKKTLGILGMRERAVMIGGEYLIESTPERGTSIIVKVPISSGN